MTPDNRYRARLPNKTGWALDDIKRDGRAIRELLKEILTWTEREYADAQHNLDKPRQARLARLNHTVGCLALTVADLERTADDARAGEYHGQTDLAAMKGPAHAA